MDARRATTTFATFALVTSADVDARFKAVPFAGRNKGKIAAVPLAQTANRAGLVVLHVTTTADARSASRHHDLLYDISMSRRERTEMHISEGAE